MSVNRKKTLWSTPRLTKMPAKHARMSGGGGMCEGQIVKIGKSMNCS